MKLMIVDDSPIIRMSIQRSLSDLGIEVVGQAGDGITAIEIFKKEKPEIITMDITMPELDGLSCIEEIMKIDSGVNIIVVTSVKNESIALKAMMKGAKGFINKPFHPNILREQFLKIKNSRNSNI